MKKKAEPKRDEKKERMMAESPYKNSEKLKDALNKAFHEGKEIVGE